MSVFETATQASLVLAFALMVLDVVSGIAKAAHTVSIAAEYALALLPTPDGVSIPDAPLVLLACAYIVLTEIVSVFENICNLNPAIANSPLGKLVSQIDVAQATDEKEEQ